MSRSRVWPGNILNQNRNVVHLADEREVEKMQRSEAIRTSKCRLIGLAAAACAVAPVFASQAQAQDQDQLHGQIRSVVASGQAVAVGHLPSEQRLRLAIVLPQRNPEELDSLLGRLYDPSSPDYHQYLRVDEFTDRFGPTVQDHQAVQDFATAHGLNVTETYPNRMVVDVEGSVARIEQALNVSMMVYKHPTEDRTFYSPDREPSLDLSVPLSHIEGLENFVLPVSHHRRATSVEAVHRSCALGDCGSGPGGQFLGSDMRAAYYGGTELTGSGQSVGLFEYYGYETADIQAYFKNAKQTNKVPINPVLLDGVSLSCPASCDDSGQVLDIVQAISMAPGLSQVRVYIGSTDADILNKMVSDNIAKQLSSSWGQSQLPSTEDPIY